MSQRLAEIEAQMADLTAERDALQAQLAAERCAAGEHVLVADGGWRCRQPLLTAFVARGRFVTSDATSPFWQPEKCAHCDFRQSNEPPRQSRAEAQAVVDAKLAALRAKA